MLSFSGLAFAPNGNLYAASVFTGRIAEYDPSGHLVRFILQPPELVPPIRTGNPQGIAVGADGSVYYADLDLVGTLPDVGPGPNGSVRRITFDAAGNPRPPDIIREGLAFPDGVALFPGNLQPKDPRPLEWPTLAGGSSRQFFNPDERHLTAAAALDAGRAMALPHRSRRHCITDDRHGRRCPGGARTRVVYASSWDGHLYAIDWGTGKEMWRFALVDQPGASYPAAGLGDLTQAAAGRSPSFGAGRARLRRRRDDRRRGLALRRRHRLRHRRCRTFPGLCGFAGERNQVESTPIVTDGTVYVGMDINDVATGKGGFYALDLDDGRLVWFFDLESGAVCRPESDRRHPALRRLPLESPSWGSQPDFLATRSGCDHPPDPHGCGDVWSSPASTRPGVCSTSAPATATPTTTRAPTSRRRPCPRTTRRSWP